MNHLLKEYKIAIFKKSTFSLLCCKLWTQTHYITRTKDIKLNNLVIYAVDSLEQKFHQCAHTVCKSCYACLYIHISLPTKCVQEISRFKLYGALIWQVGLGWQFTFLFTLYLYHSASKVFETTIPFYSRSANQYRITVDVIHDI